MRRAWMLVCCAWLAGCAVGPTTPAARKEQAAVHLDLASAEPWESTYRSLLDALRGCWGGAYSLPYLGQINFDVRGDLYPESRAGVITMFYTTTLVTLVEVTPAPAGARVQLWSDATGSLDAAARLPPFLAGTAPMCDWR